MIKIILIGAVNLTPISPATNSTVKNNQNTSSFAIGCKLVLKVSGKEVFRTELASSSSPVWNAVYNFPSSLLSTKSRENCRPFYFETIDVDILDFSRNQTYGERLYEGRIPLINIGKVDSYKLIRVVNSSKDSEDISITDSFSEARVNVDISCIIASPDDPNSGPLPSPQDMKRLQLYQVLPLHLPQFHHLYMNFDDWTSGSVIGCNILPGPRLGEIVLDEHKAEWGSTISVNAFGDRCTVICRGKLFLTDLRLIFVPSEVQGPSWIENILPCETKISGTLSQEQIILIRRLTIQIPIFAIQDIRFHPENSECEVIVFEAKDGSCLEFRVRRNLIVRSRSDNGPNPLTSSSTSRSSLKSHTSQVDYNVMLDKSKSSSAIYRAGLDTEDVAPHFWCARISDEIFWRIREDMIWVNWMKYLEQTCDKYYPLSELSWLKSVRQLLDYEVDFQRLRAQDSNWMFSDLNRNYKLCSTYPQTLVVPGALTDEEVIECASHRSRGRIASLVWIHPSTKASLCRSAQPMAGMSGSSNEADRKFCISIKTSCPRGLPLRIADARPRLNANANAIQGKGFENIAFLGGSKNAVLVFLDIENIHVVRNSFLKLKEGLMLSGLSGGPESNADAFSSSKWNYHLSQLMKGAVSIAESLVIGHPILLHCSDGWDRTAQLSALAQVLLDPYYRTIQGFFVLINKDFFAFGHRFESRSGKIVPNSKETCPIFYQFLDTVYQLVMQYPSLFEYTTYFLLMLAQCVYSGYFSSFRGNCDRERYILLRLTTSVENLSYQNCEFSTVFCYLGILLRCPNYARLMLNPNYCPTSSYSNIILDGSYLTANASSSRSSSFLRPKCSVNDMVLWREGVFGYTPDTASYFGKYSPTLHENQTIQALAYNRLLSYIQAQSNHLDPCIIDRMQSILYHDNYLYNTTSSIPYQQPWETTSLAFRKQHAKLAISQNNESKLSRRQISAAARILIWYRSEKALNQSWNSFNLSMMSLSVRKLIKQIFRSLLQSEYRMKMKLHWISSRLVNNWMKSLVDDVIEEALTRCIRSDMVLSPNEALEAAYAQLAMPSNQNNMIDPIGAAKSISSKIRNMNWASNLSNNISNTISSPQGSLHEGNNPNISPMRERSSSPSMFRETLPSYSSSDSITSRHSSSETYTPPHRDSPSIDMSMATMRLGMTKHRGSISEPAMKTEETPKIETQKVVHKPFDPLSDLLNDADGISNVRIVRKENSVEKLDRSEATLASKMMNLMSNIKP